MGGGRHPAPAWAEPGASHTAAPASASWRSVQHTNSRRSAEQRAYAAAQSGDMAEQHTASTARPHRQPCIGYDTAGSTTWYGAVVVRPARQQLTTRCIRHSTELGALILLWSRPPLQAARPARINGGAPY